MRGIACLLLIAGTAGPATAAAQARPDSGAAVTAVLELTAACRKDAGRLWDRSLCGPLIAVHGPTGFAVAEYTGTRLALEATGLTPARVSEATADFESRPTYVRALGYGTGPLLGLLLDRYASGWRARIHEAGFARALAPAVGFAVPENLAGAVADAASRYGGDDLAREEDERSAARARAVAEYRSRLVEGPVVVLSADEMYRSFNPNTLVPLDSSGTVYPTGTFNAVWGTLTVSEGGALVIPGNRGVRVSVAAALDSTASIIEGRGWRLELATGWRLQPGPRPGDFTAVRVASEAPDPVQQP